MSSLKVTNWYVYIIEATDSSLYTGITTDVLRRWNEHTNNKGAKYFRGRKPKSLFYVEALSSRSEASKREYLIKQLSRKDKLSLDKEEQNISEAYLEKLEKI